MKSLRWNMKYVMILYTKDLNIINNSMKYEMSILYVKVTKNSLKYEICDDLIHNSHEK